MTSLRRTSSTGSANALILWGQALWHQAEYASAYNQTTRALEYAQAHNDIHRKALALSRLGIIADRGDSTRKHKPFILSRLNLRAHSTTDVSNAWH
jgi:hypothetical protein